MCSLFFVHACVAERVVVEQHGARTEPPVGLVHALQVRDPGLLGEPDALERGQCRVQVVVHHQVVVLHHESEVLQAHRHFQAKPFVVLAAPATQAPGQFGQVGRDDEDADDMRAEHRPQIHEQLRRVVEDQVTPGRDRFVQRRERGAAQIPLYRMAPLHQPVVADQLLELLRVHELVPVTVVDAAARIDRPPGARGVVAHVAEARVVLAPALDQRRFSGAARAGQHVEHAFAAAAQPGVVHRRVVGKRHLVWLPQFVVMLSVDEYNHGNHCARGRRALGVHWRSHAYRPRINREPTSEQDRP